MSYTLISGVCLSVCDRRNVYLGHDSSSPSKPNTLCTPNPLPKLSEKHFEEPDFNANVPTNWISKTKAWFGLVGTVLERNCPKHHEYPRRRRPPSNRSGEPRRLPRLVTWCASGASKTSRALQTHRGTRRKVRASEACFPDVVHVQCPVEPEELNLSPTLDPPSVVQQVLSVTLPTHDDTVPGLHDVPCAEELVDLPTSEPTVTETPRPSKYDIDLVGSASGPIEGKCSFQPASEVPNTSDSNLVSLAEPLVAEPRNPGFKGHTHPPASPPSQKLITDMQSSTSFEHRIVARGRNDVLVAVTPPCHPLNLDLDLTVQVASYSEPKPAGSIGHVNSTNNSNPNPLGASPCSGRQAMYLHTEVGEQARARRLPRGHKCLIPTPLPSFTPPFPATGWLLWGLVLSSGSSLFFLLDGDLATPNPLSFDSSAPVDQVPQDGNPLTTGDEIQSGQGPGSAVSPTLEENIDPDHRRISTLLVALLGRLVAERPVHQQSDVQIPPQSRAPPHPPPPEGRSPCCEQSYYKGWIDGCLDMLPSSTTDDTTQSLTAQVDSTTPHGDINPHLTLPVFQHSEGSFVSPVPTPVDSAATTPGWANLPSSFVPQPADPPPIDSLLQSTTRTGSSSAAHFVGSSSFPGTQANQAANSEGGTPTTAPWSHEHSTPTGTTASPDPGPTALSGRGKARKPRQCAICNTVFRRPYLLRDHMATHTGGEKPHLCMSPECAMTFASHSNMMRHFKRDHPSTNSSRISPEAIGQPMQPGTTEQAPTAGTSTHSTIPGADSQHSGQLTSRIEDGALAKYARRRQRK